MSSRRPKYQTKKVVFNGEELELYSLDGFTWSSRKDELPVIQERHETDRFSHVIRCGNRQAVKWQSQAAKDGCGPEDPGRMSYIGESRDERQNGNPRIQRHDDDASVHPVGESAQRQ